jgi:hypothetical protein
MKIKIFINIYKMNFKNINFNINDIYKIGLYEVIILFIILFFTYTMPMTMYKFTSSFFGKLVSLLSIMYAAYYNIAYGVVLAILYLGISEIGYLEGFKDNVKKTVVPSAKEAFIKEHCTDKKTKFNLDTIETDYPELVFTDGVCDPCDPTCRYVISNTAESLYDFDHKIKPKDSTYSNIKEPFKSTILTNLKGEYKKNRRKAAMIKDGFTNKVADNVRHYARKYNL